jgi:hypothetical protein
MTGCSLAMTMSESSVMTGGGLAMTEKNKPLGRYTQLPIYKLAMQTAVMIEAFVKHFPRYHKYTLGSELRNEMHKCLQAIMFAGQYPQSRQAQLEQVCDRLDKILLALRLCYHCKVGSYSAVTTLMECMAKLHKQANGCLRHHCLPEQS